MKKWAKPSLCSSWCFWSTCFSVGGTLTLVFRGDFKFPGISWTGSVVGCKQSQRFLEGIREISWCRWWKGQPDYQNNWLQCLHNSGAQDHEYIEEKMLESTDLEKRVFKKLIGGDFKGGSSKRPLWHSHVGVVDTSAILNASRCPCLGCWIVTGVTDQCRALKSLNTQLIYKDLNVLIWNWISSEEFQPQEPAWQVCL